MKKTKKTSIKIRDLKKLDKAALKKMSGGHIVNCAGSFREGTSPTGLVTKS